MTADVPGDWAGDPENKRVMDDLMRLRDAAATPEQRAAARDDVTDTVMSPLMDQFNATPDDLKRVVGWYSYGHAVVATVVTLAVWVLALVARFALGDVSWLVVGVATALTLAQVVALASMGGGRHRYKGLARRALATVLVFFVPVAMVVGAVVVALQHWVR